MNFRVVFKIDITSVMKHILNYFATEGEQNFKEWNLRTLGYHPSYYV